MTASEHRQHIIAITKVPRYHLLDGHTYNHPFYHQIFDNALGDILPQIAEFEENFQLKKMYANQLNLEDKLYLKHIITFVYSD